MKKKLESISNINYLLAELKVNYSDKILEYENEFDVVIIDGRERVQCAKNCLKSLKNNGVIIWDNSDESQYTEGFDYLTIKGFKKIDFEGMGPIGYTKWRTSIYYRDDNCFDI